MRQYLDLCKHVLENGTKKEDRTGTGTLSVFGYQMRYNLAEGFPLMTTKDMVKPNKLGVSRLDAIVHELLWFLKGDTNIRYLLKNGVNIWNDDAYNYFKRSFPDSSLSKADYLDLVKYDELGQVIGSLGYVYGKQWRSWENIDKSGNVKTIDQIANVIEDIKNNPDSRRLIVSAWNVGELNQMALPPCHVLFQFYVADGKLSCQLYQRSGDIFLGVPFNIASYALLTMMIADQCGLEYGEFVHTLGDAHIYLNHVEQIKLQLERKPYALPKMLIKKDVPSIDNYKRENFKLIGYKYHPSIKGVQSS